MMLNGNTLGADELGELGWGFRSIGRLAKRAAKGAYSVASLPTSVARKVANAAAATLCRDGKSATGDASSQAFCRAVKFKDQVSIRKYLPNAVQQAAQRAAAARATYNRARAAAMSDADTNLLAGLAGADQGDLAFALAGVDPNEISGAVTTTDMLAMAPVAAAVAAGLWMLTRG